MHMLVDGALLYAVLLNLVLGFYQFGRLAQKVDDTNARLSRIEKWFYNHIAKRP
jgi:hypothetical protein